MGSSLTGAAALLCAVAVPAWGQLEISGSQTDQFLQRQRALQEDARRQLDRELPLSQKFRVDYGGWFDTYLLLFDDGVDSSRTLRQYNLRLWASLSADEGIHEAYLRTRATYADWNHGDSFTRNEDDLDGPNLERGWYQFDIAKALRKHGGASAPFELKTKIGREFIDIGTGYAISLPLDMVSLTAEALDFETTLVTGRTPASTENIDRSRPVADHSNRAFWILQTRYLGFDKHTPFVYVAWQDDRTSEDPPDYLQNYRYDSRYIGWGSTGEIVKNLGYTTEWVIERGHSFGHERFLHTDEIKAWAFDHRLEYFFQHETKPRLSAEYMFASGDADRLDSPTNADGGNRDDYVDHSFVGFGFRDTGLALAPRLSNVHIWRVGGSFRPLPKVKAAENLELGTDWFLFWKHHRAAAISDPLADQRSGYLGWEMDYFANYRISSDLSWTVRFGAFFPGDAFSDQTTRTFLLTGLSWSF